MVRVNKDLELFRDFLLHILVAVVLFFALAGASMLLEDASDWIDRHHYSRLISLTFLALSYIIFVFDIGSVIFFLAIQTYKFVRNTWNSRNG